MRTTVWLTLVVVCVGLAGCKHSSRNDAAPSPGPYSGGGSSPRPDASRPERNSAPAGADGLLAGQIFDAYNKRPAGVSIQVVDLQDTRQAPARIEVDADDKGYFTIQGLQVGRHYQLIARVKDGNKLLSGTTLAMPPNPRLSIYLSEDNTTSGTPQPPSPPGLPEKRKPPDGGAAIEAPVRWETVAPNDGENPPHRGQISPPGSGAVIPAPKAINPPNRTNVADGGSVKDFVPPKVAVPNPYGAPKADRNNPKEDTLPPADAIPPRKDAVPDKALASDGPGARTPTGQTPVGSCVLVGQKLEDFCLTTLEGEAWQYKREHKGQLVLLDFWTTGKDLAHVNQLTKLQKRYGSYGLEVIGIAYEMGSAEQQGKNVRSIRGRYGVNYTTILGAPAESCQVKKQFEVTKYPTLILLDERGKILAKNEDGLEKPLAQELETLIRQQLGITDTSPRIDE